MAEQKEFQMFHLLQVTGNDDVITGIKVVMATKGSVILDLLLLHNPTASPRNAFQTFERVLKTTPKTTTRMMNFLKVRSAMEMNYVEYKSSDPVRFSKFPISTAIVAPVLLVVIVVLAVVVYRMKRSRGTPDTHIERGLDNKGVDA